MLRRVRLALQWRKIEAALPPDWSAADLRITVGDDARLARASAILAPLGLGVTGRNLVLTASTRGDGAGPDRVRRALIQLDRERIVGAIELVSAKAVPARPERQHLTFVAAWDRALAQLPEDWSDAYAEVEFVSTDNLDRGALLLAPVNPARHAPAASFRFRCARRFGYGASAGMTRRCLERLDEDGIRGDVRILRALSDTKPVSTQGPVWYLGGRAV
jgi:hypothetical protein